MKTLILFTLMTLSGAAAQAQGDRIGNGGLGIAHYSDGNSTMISGVTLLDTFERDYDDLFELGFMNASEEKILGKIHERLSAYPEFLKKYDEAMKVVKDAQHVEGSNAPERNSTLPLSNDHGYFYYSQRAELVQVANMRGDRLFINDRFYHHLSIRDRAALSIHEAVYAVERIPNQAITSVHSRKIVRALLAKKFDKKRLAKLLGEIGY